jgi:hypothetical protein
MARIAHLVCHNILDHKDLLQDRASKNLKGEIISPKECDACLSQNPLSQV